MASSDGDPMDRRFRRAEEAVAAAALQANLQRLSPERDDDNGRRMEQHEDSGIMDLDESLPRPQGSAGGSCQGNGSGSNATNTTWRDLSHLITTLTQDTKLPPTALGRIAHYATAPDDERAFMAYIGNEVVRAQIKAVADDWEPSAQLKTLLRTRIQACLLSPHIPSYKGSLLAHTLALVPATSKSLLGDETNDVHVEQLRAFVDKHATTYRASMKAVFTSSMSRHDAATGKSALDVSQGWCIGMLCEKLVEGNAIKVTIELQGRVALIRDVMCSYPVESQTAAFWDLVDNFLDRQRKLTPAVLAADVTNGLRDDINKYTQSGGASKNYALVDKTSIAADSVQARADLTMRDYFKIQRDFSGHSLKRGRKRKTATS